MLAAVLIHLAVLPNSTSTCGKAVWPGVSWWYVLLLVSWSPVLSGALVLVGLMVSRWSPDLLVVSWRSPSGCCRVGRRSGVCGGDRLGRCGRHSHQGLHDCLGIYAGSCFESLFCMQLHPKDMIRSPHRNWHDEVPPGGNT